MKTIQFLLGGAAVASLLLMSISCDCLITPDGPVTPELQPDEQKAKLEEVALALLETSPAADMQELVDIYTAFEDTYLANEDYDYSALETFAEDTAEDVYEDDSKGVYDELKKQYVRTSVTNLAVTLSNHTGEFVFGENAVSKVSDSTFDGVKVTFPLNGRNYTAELKSSGKVTRATYDYKEYDKWYDYGYYDPETDEWVYVEDGNIENIHDYVFKCTIDVPEKIEIGIYEGGSPVVAVTIELTKNFSAEGLNPAVDNFNSKITVVLNNGYEFVADKVLFDGAKKQAGSAVTFKKDGNVLVSAEAFGDVSLANDKYESEDSEGSYYEYTTVEVKSAKNVNMIVDVLGQVQFKGSCSNAMEAYEAHDAYYEALSDWDNETGSDRTPDEVAALRHLNNLNAKLDLGVYYDGGSNRQAKVVFEMDKVVEEPYWDRNYDGYINADDSYVYYGLIPVIVFNDNSRYTVEDYFTEEAFETLMDSLEGFADDYDALLGTIGIAKEEDVLPDYGEYH